MTKKSKPEMSQAEKDHLHRLYEDGIERMHICNAARLLLGFGQKHVISISRMELTEALPRYRVLGICIRAALYGFQNPTVKHMVERNRTLDEYAALERMAKQEGLA